MLQALDDYGSSKSSDYLLDEESNGAVQEDSQQFLQCRLCY